MSWNKKNDQFATACDVRPSTEKAWRWILRRTKPNEVGEYEIDLRVFNQEIARHRARGGYDRKTLKEILAQLDERTQGHILITKSYTWAVHRILVRPLDWVLQNSQKQADSPKLKTENPMFGSDHKKSSRELLLQNISKLDTLFRKLGMNYTPDALMRIWRMAGKNLAEVKSAVEYMLSYHAGKVRNPRCKEDQEGVTSPKGFLHECLKYGWHHDAQVIELPVMKYDAISSFVASLAGDIRGSDPLPDPI